MCATLSSLCGARGKKIEKKMIKIDVKKSYTQNVDNDVDKEKWLKI